MENLQFIEYLPYEEIQKRFEKMSDGAVSFFVSQGGYPYIMVRIKDSFIALFQDNENVKAMTEEGATPLPYKELPQAFTAMIDEIKGTMGEHTVTAARHYFAGCWTMFQKGLTEDVLRGILQNDCPKEEGVVITCSSGITGRCFRKGCDMRYCGEYTYYQCEFSGYKRDYCTHPC